MKGKLYNQEFYSIISIFHNDYLSGGSLRSIVFEWLCIVALIFMTVSIKSLSICLN